MKRCIFSLLLSLCSLMGVESVEVLQNQKVDGEKELSRGLDFVKGHHNFKNLFFKEHEEEFVRLAREGQTPKTLFIGCSDSRVIPELISQAKPGDLFVIRTAGNFVPTYDPNIYWDGVAATIEYAVEVLDVKDIIVCGHSHCGAIKGLFTEEIFNSPKFRILANWLQFGKEAKQITDRIMVAKVPDEVRYTVAEHLSVLSQLDHLMSYSFIKKKVQEKKIYLHGWYFSIETGQISYFDPEKFQFLPISNLVTETKQVEPTKK